MQLCLFALLYCWNFHERIWNLLNIWQPWLRRTLPSTSGPSTTWSGSIVITVNSHTRRILVCDITYRPSIRRSMSSTPRGKRSWQCRHSRRLLREELDLNRRLKLLWLLYRSNRIHHYRFDRFSQCRIFCSTNNLAPVQIFAYSLKHYLKLLI